MATLEGTVGPTTQTTGSAGTAHYGWHGDFLVAQYSPRYAELVGRNKVFAAATAATGVAPGTAIGTTAAYALYNPQGSGKNLAVLAASLGYVSGTLGAGVVHYIGHLSPSQTAFTGTTITARNCLLGNTATGVGLAYTTATVPASGSILGTFCSLQASLASTAVAPWQVVEHLDGLLMIAPGGGVSIQATAAAGTSPLVIIGLVWAEMDVLS